METRLTSRASHDAFPPLPLRQVGHLVVCSAQFEAEDGLEVLALEEYVAFISSAEIGRVSQFSWFDDIVDIGIVYQSKVLNSNVNAFLP